MHKKDCIFRRNPNHRRKRWGERRWSREVAAPSRHQPDAGPSTYSSSWVSKQLLRKEERLFCFAPFDISGLTSWRVWLSQRPTKQEQLPRLIPAWEAQSTVLQRQQNRPIKILQASTAPHLLCQQQHLQAKTCKVKFRERYEMEWTSWPRIFPMLWVISRWSD